MGRTLADRLRSHEQQKARLAEREMQLKEAARKARTRRLIQAGGLVEKAGRHRQLGICRLPESAMN